MLMLSPFLSAPLRLNNVLHAENSTPYARSEMQAQSLQNYDHFADNYTPASTHVNVSLPEAVSDTARFTENSIGITDKLYNVIYITMPNGKYAVQESSWSSGDAAMLRIKELNAMKIAGVKATLTKADLPDKGIRYRVIIGEFKTLDDAIKSAGKLRQSK